MHWLLLFVRIFVYTEEICLSLYKFKDKEGGGGGEEEISINVYRSLFLPTIFIRTVFKK